MKPITKRYLKTFLFMGIPYGIITVGIDLVKGDGFEIWKFLFSTTIFGATMSLGLVSFQRYLLKQSGIDDITNENLSVNQTKNLTTKLNKAALIEKLKNDPFTGKMKIKEMENGVLLTTGMTWQSWGEEIKMMIKSENDNYFEYQVTSCPKLKTTLVDYGKNLENINRIESAIKKIA